MAKLRKAPRDPWQHPVDIDVFAQALGFCWGDVDREELPHWRGFRAPGIQWVREDWDTYLYVNDERCYAEWLEDDESGDRMPRTHRTRRSTTDLSLPCSIEAAYTWACQQGLWDNDPDERRDFLNAYHDIRLRPLKRALLKSLGLESRSDLL